MGPVERGPVKGRGLAMHFPGNKGYINCYLERLSREQPVRGVPGRVRSISCGCVGRACG